MRGLIEIRLSGRFRVSTTEGQELTPSSAKGQGLIALLATQPNLERGRGWLQDKLWSDRGQESGAGSLRQELTQIRKKLGSCSHVLVADRHKVYLNPDLVVIAATSANEDEFLEGIDVRDQEFSAWLRLERSNRQRGSAEPVPPTIKSKFTAPRPRSVVFVGDVTTPIDLKIFEKQFVDSVTRSLRELTHVQVHTHTPTIIENGQLVVSTQAFLRPGYGASLRASVEDMDGRGVLWSDTLTDVNISTLIDENPNCLTFVNRLLDAINNALFDDSGVAGDNCDAAALANLALRKIFSIDQEELIAADTMLRKAHEIDPQGLFEAWRAQLFTIQFVERFSSDTAELAEKCDASCANALAADPTNSNVLAAVANARTIIGKNFTAGGELAVLSVRSNPANPLAWWAFSNAKQYAGEFELAYSAAARAQQLASGTRFEFWVNFQRSLTAAMTDRHQEAIRLGELSSALAPNFRPPLRYLTALYAKQNNREDAVRAAHQLTNIEKDFSIDRMANDPDYPVSIMRQSGLIDREKLSDLVN